MEGIIQILGWDWRKSILWETHRLLPEARGGAGQPVLQGEHLMFEFTYSIKFRKGDSIVTMTIRAINEHQVYEKLGITKAEVIELKMIDGI